MAEGGHHCQYKGGHRKGGPHALAERQFRLVHQGSIGVMERILGSDGRAQEGQLQHGAQPAMVGRGLGGKGGGGPLAGIGPQALKGQVQGAVEALEGQGPGRLVRRLDLP